MKKFILLSACCISMSLYSQKEDIAFFGGVNIQNEISKSKISGDITMRYYTEDKFSFGIQLLYNSKKYNDGFEFLTDRTILNNATINAIVQYDFVEKDNFILSAFLGNGVNFIELNNLNDIRTVQYFDLDLLLFYEVETPRKLKQNKFYVFTPGIDLSFKLATLGKSEKLGLYLTTRTGYQFSFGSNTFTGLNNSNTFTGSSGITIKGTSKKVN